MAIIKHTSRIKEINKSGSRNEIIYTGTFEEMQQIQEMNTSGVVNEQIGCITSSRVYQAAGKWWECQLVADFDSCIGPDTAYGKKSAQLTGSMLQCALASHPDYRTCWDHYLFAAPGITSVPSFWKSAQGITLSDADAQKYKWGKTPNDAPVTNGKLWKAIKDPLPEMKGVETFDMSVYTLVISARFATFGAAVSMVARELNNVSSSPGVTINVGGGNWKCDNATVQWHDKYWLSTLTWSKSGDSKGWNKLLYGGN